MRRRSADVKVREARPRMRVGRRSPGSCEGVAIRWCWLRNCMCVIGREKVSGRATVGESLTEKRQNIPW